MEPDASYAGAIAAAPKLTIITVVKDDLPGLEATLAGTQALCGCSYEHWVIDGSRRPDVREYLSRRGDLSCVSEPDSGIFDAMNKGLERAKGDFVLFLNAGDVISKALDTTALFARLAAESGSPWRKSRAGMRSGIGSVPRRRDEAVLKEIPASFDNEGTDPRTQAGPARLLPRAARVLIGHTIEVYRDLRWLRPGANRASDVFNSPAHQATFYPRWFYANNRYRVQPPVGADGAYTGRAIRQCGAMYLPLIVCEFQLGGLSSNYQSAGVLRQRMSAAATLRGKGALLLKFCLWRILPRGMFYSLLAAFKYTRLKSGDVPRLRAVELSRPAETE